MFDLLSVIVQTGCLFYDNSHCSDFFTAPTSVSDFVARYEMALLLVLYIKSADDVPECS